MTTNAYWAEVENAEGAESRVYWAEVENGSDVAYVYWAEVENAASGDGATNSGEVPEITTVTLSGGSTVADGETLDLTATVLDQDGDPVPNLTLTATSSATGIATVSVLAATDATGQATVRVTGVSGGSASITVEADGRLAQEPITVTVAQTTTVTLTVPTISLEVGLTGSASVLVVDQDGNPISGATVTWSSSNDAVVADPAAGTTGSTGTASVSFVALAAGTTAIGATVNGVSATPVTVTVFAVADPPTYSGSGSAQIIVTAESRLAGWERPKVRRFNDADQKKLYPTDRFFEGMVEGVEVEVVWPSKEVLRRYA